MHRPARRDQHAHAAWHEPGANVARPRRRAVVAFLAVMLVLAFLEREVWGKHEGSLRAWLAPYIVKYTGDERTEDGQRSS